MESHDLRIFKQVADLQSVSKAAEKLGYVQPNVSQRIKSLEDELGVRLFLRNNRGVTLTEQGVILLDYANRIVELMDEVTLVLQQEESRECLTIGAPQTVSAVKIPQLFASFLQDVRHMDVKLKTNDKQHLLSMLSYGELDGAFVQGEYSASQFDTVHSYWEEVVLISPHPGKDDSSHDPVLIVNGDKNCIYRNKTLEYARVHHPEHPVIMEFDSLESILQAVHDGMGMSIVPTSAVHGREALSTVQHKRLSERIRIDFIIRHTKKQPPGLRKFIRFLQNQPSESV
ncbi:LysR family transcriptional regulator [Paenibacillus dauci]|uniref:LysR family transcriptional regulator n=1 Tax=Paenibacillus dauci TaxID=1567106 RepID=UPI0006192E24|nr:LysR family transcriptional regulator [Paenibacillus dauci]